ncbi:MAG: DUF4468 domain-containing protein [Bacteroidales bacterium]|nr:DUF4468 domain-containing protein [Bacteroidales bacterium]
MKTIWLGIFALILAISTQAQDLPINSETKLISYNNVVEVSGTADELYNKAHRWFFSYYKNPTNVVKESANQKIVAKPRFKILNPADKNGVQTMAGIVLYSFTVEFKEGRFRYEITNVEWQQNSKYPIERWMDKTSPSYNEKYNYYLEQVDKEMKLVVDALTKAMLQAEKTQKSDW